LTTSATFTTPSTTTTKISAITSTRPSAILSDQLSMNEISFENKNDATQSSLHELPTTSKFVNFMLTVADKSLPTTLSPHHIHNLV